MERTALEAELKQMLVDTLMLESPTASAIDSETPLFGDGVGLDSVDALELGIAISKRYGIQIESSDAALKPAFGSIRALAEFVGARLPAGGASR